MHVLLNTLWAEQLKARRSRVPIFTAAGFLILPCIAGLFMLILKNPEHARGMGLISTKAQLSAGVADWPTFLSMLTQGVAIGGGMLFAMITTWVFGREFSDHTIKELLALPTPRGMIVAAKMILIVGWILALALIIFIVGIAIGMAVTIPGWSVALAWDSFRVLLMIALLHCMLMPLIALIASAGRGYLPPMGWAFFTIVMAQIAAALGWGDWFPWAVPALLSGMLGPQAQQLGLHSYLSLCMVGAIGIAFTWLWWRDADQSR